MTIPTAERTAAEQAQLFTEHCFLCGTPYHVTDIQSTRKDGWLYFNIHSIVCPQCKGENLDDWLQRFKERHT